MMKEITLKDVMDALSSVYTEVELPHLYIVALAGAVMPLIESAWIEYKLLEALKDELLEENEELEKKLERYQRATRKIQGAE